MKVENTNIYTKAKKSKCGTFYDLPRLITVVLEYFEFCYNCELLKIAKSNNAVLSANIKYVDYSGNSFVLLLKALCIRKPLDCLVLTTKQLYILRAFLFCFVFIHGIENSFNFSTPPEVLSGVTVIWYS